MNSELVSDRIVPSMYAGPPGIAPVVPFLRLFPRHVARELLAVMTIADAVVRHYKWRKVRAWVRAQKPDSLEWRLALSLLANHGRFMADEAMIGVPDLDALRRDVTVEGRDHLAAQTNGAILLGFHLGPPRTALTLRAFGINVHLSGRLNVPQSDPRWREALQSADVVRLPEDSPAGRAEGLHAIHNLLRSGALVYLTADGAFGREAFRIPLPGPALVVRSGWLTLRRLTGVATLPVLTYKEGRRRVIRIHPPLPEPLGDFAADVESCRTVLTPLVTEYVRLFPTQCRYLALATEWESAMGSAGV